MRLYDEYFCTNSSDIYKEILNKMGMTSWAEEERAYVPSIKAEYVPSIKKSSSTIPQPLYSGMTEPRQLLNALREMSIQKK